MCAGKRMSTFPSAQNNTHDIKQYLCVPTLSRDGIIVVKENVPFAHANSNIQQNNSCPRLITVVFMPSMHIVTLLQSVNIVLTNCASIPTLPKEVDETFSNTPLPNIKTRCRIIDILCHSYTASCACGQDS